MDIQKRAIEITAELVRIKSITFGELKVAQYLQEFLSGLGFKVAIDEANNVVGELKGEGGGPRLFFLGHHDTVEEGELSLWKHDPFCGEIIAGELWGRGSADEKGGLGACLAALEKMVLDKEQLKGDILFASTREETSDIGTRGIMKVIEKGIKADYCVVLEPTELNIVVGHKGRVVFEITAYGQTAHSSVPEKGINAINHMGHILVELERMKLPNRLPLGQGTQSVGMIKGGVRPNIVPEKCSLEADRRIVGGETSETVYDELKGMIDELQKKIPHLKAEIKIKPPFYPSYIDEKEPIVAIAKQASLEAGQNSEIRYEVFHTDGEWVVNDAKIPAVILGPGSVDYAHAANERIPVAQLGKAAEIYYCILKNTVL